MLIGVQPLRVRKRMSLLNLKKKGKKSQGPAKQQRNSSETPSSTGPSTHRQACQHTCAAFSSDVLVASVVSLTK